jgi:hypothetical protein
MQFDAKKPFFTKFIVVPNRITGKKEGKMRVKWLQNRITTALFLGYFRGDFYSLSPLDLYENSLA